MQLQLWREECKEKAAERKTAVFWSVEEQDVWQVVRIKIVCPFERADFQYGSCYS